jgi:betaine-aldehyde dehydrogenase
MTSSHHSLPCYQSFVNGQYVSNQTNETFDVINPATGLVIYQVEVADDNIKEAAIGSAQQGFVRWSKMSAIERSRILLKAVALLRERNDELAKIEVLEMHYQRAQGFARGHAKQSAREDKLRNVGSLIK